MLLWRLYRRAHGPGLDGTGGRYAAGRWNELGTPAVYCGASPEISVLETLAHIDADLLPSDLMLGRFEGDVSLEEIGAIEELTDLAATRRLGHKFLTSRSACVLRVPSVILPEASNLLFNPLHPEASRVQLAAERPFSFDERLI
jgi:RES domain-containing protein